LTLNPAARRLRLSSPTLVKTLILVAFVVLWQLLSEVSPREILPGPLVVLSALVSLLELRTIPGLPHALGLTLLEILAGFLIATTLGLSTALLFSMRRILRGAYLPIVIVIFAIPHIIIFPVFIVIFGLGALSKIAYGVLAAYPVIVLGGYGAISRVDRSTIIAARSLGVSARDLLTKIVIPASVSSLAGTLRVAFAVVIATTIVAEMIGSVDGLGYYLTTAYEEFNTPEYLAMALVVMVFATGLNSVASLLESRMKRWRRG
jgi:NitT/TauT family transport system permease protein